MSSEYLYGQSAIETRKRTAKLPRPSERRGIPATGRISKLFVGQGHGFIRLENDAEVFFHRSDVDDGTSINDLAIGDLVTFERLDDVVSGARALSVRRRRT